MRYCVSAVSVLFAVAQGRAVVSRAVQHIRVRHYSVLVTAAHDRAVQYSAVLCRAG